jgi:hypothetical protein
MGDWSWGVELLNTAAGVIIKNGDALRASLSLIYAAGCSWGLGDVTAAFVTIERGVAMARNAGNTEALSRGMLLLAWLETERDLDRAEAAAVAGEQEAAKISSVFDRAHYREVRGFIHCLKGDLGQAAEVLAETMTLLEQIQVNCAAHGLETAAAWAAMNGRFELAAEMLGSADCIRAQTGDKPRPWERLVRDVWLPKIPAALDPAVFQAAHRRGANRIFPDPLRYARRDLLAATTQVKPLPT